MRTDILKTSLILIRLLAEQKRSEELTEKVLRPLQESYQVVSMIQFCMNNPTKTDTELIDQAKIFASMKEIP